MGDGPKALWQRVSPPSRGLSLLLPPPQHRAQNPPRAHPEDDVEAKQEVFPAAADLGFLEVLVLAGHGEWPHAGPATGPGGWAQPSAGSPGLEPPGA